MSAHRARICIRCGAIEGRTETRIERLSCSHRWVNSVDWVNDRVHTGAFTARPSEVEATTGVRHECCVPDCGHTYWDANGTPGTDDDGWIRHTETRMHLPELAGVCVDCLSANVSELEDTIRQALQELDAEHYPMWANPHPGGRGFTTKPVDGKDPVGCITCYSADSDWPCITRMIADDLRKKIEPKQKEQ